MPHIVSIGLNVCSADKPFQIFRSDHIETKYNAANSKD